MGGNETVALPPAFSTKACYACALGFQLFLLGSSHPLPPRPDLKQNGCVCCEAFCARALLPSGLLGNVEDLGPNLPS